jgi:hypothetical protein
MVWNNDSQACDGTATLFSWTEALGYVKANRTGGWRLPNAKELFSIVEPGTVYPAIDVLAFPDTPQLPFLSSTTMKSEGDIRPLFAYFDLGGLDRWDYQGGFHLRLVRRGRQ